MAERLISPVDEVQPGAFSNTTIVSEDHIITAHECKLPGRYEEFADAIENFEVRDDDVWVCAYPKTGTTWTQEMLWMISNDLDHEGGKVPIAARFPLLEWSITFPTPTSIQNDPDDFIHPEFILDSVNYVAKMPSPRFIKSHLPMNLLPRQLRTGEKKPKMIHITRNPKDTCISFYHFLILLGKSKWCFEEFCNLFLRGEVHFGLFWKHALGFANRRNSSNVLFLNYEDMKKDLSSVINKTATFLGKNLTPDQVSLLAEHLSFSSMKKNPATKRRNKFMRSGKLGQWRTEMTPDIIEKFDDMTQRYFSGTGLFSRTLDDSI